MKNFLSYMVAFLSLAMSATVFATTMNLYEKPDAKSKKVATIDSKKQLIPIFHNEKNEWTKVANPENGDVGWIKTNELKGPKVITQISDSGVKQEIIMDSDKKGAKPFTYKMVQYSSSDQIDSKEADKTFKEMEKRHQKMRKSFQKMQQEMQKSMQKMFRDFDKSFATLQ